MAVYTDVAAEDLAEFLKGYDIGELLSYKGIAEKSGWRRTICRISYR